MNCPICNKETISHLNSLKECKSTINDLTHFFADSTTMKVIKYQSDIISCIITFGYNFLLIKETSADLIMSFDEPKSNELFNEIILIQNAKDLKNRIYQLYKEQIFQK